MQNFTVCNSLTFNIAARWSPGAFFTFSNHTRKVISTHYRTLKEQVLNSKRQPWNCIPFSPRISLCGIMQATERKEEHNSCLTSYLPPLISGQILGYRTVRSQCMGTENPFSNIVVSNSTQRQKHMKNDLGSAQYSTEKLTMQKKNFPDSVFFNVNAWLMSGHEIVIYFKCCQIKQRRM